MYFFRVANCAQAMHQASETLGIPTVLLYFEIMRAKVNKYLIFSKSLKLHVLFQSG